MIAEGLTSMILGLFLLLSAICIVVFLAIAAQMSYMGGRRLTRRLLGRRRRRRLEEASKEPRELPIAPAFQWPERKRIEAHTERRAA